MIKSLNIKLFSYLSQSTHTYQEAIWRYDRHILKINYQEIRELLCVCISQYGTNDKCEDVELRIFPRSGPIRREMRDFPHLLSRASSYRISTNESEPQTSSSCWRNLSFAVSTQGRPSPIMRFTRLHVPALL